MHNSWRHGLKTVAWLPYTSSTNHIIQTNKEKKTKTILIGLYLFSRPYNRLQNFIIGVVIGRLILGVRTHQTYGWRGKKKTNKRGKRPLIITPPRTKKQKNTTLLTLSSARVRLLYPAWGFSTVLVRKTCDYLKSLSLFTQLDTATLRDMAKNKHFQSAWGIVRTSSRSCPVDSLWSSVEILCTFVGMLLCRGLST